MGRNAGGQGRGVIQAAFAVLGGLEDAGEAGLSELARACGLPKATTHRLLAQLEAVGAVEHHHGRYRLGGRCHQLGKAWRPSSALRAAAAAPAAALAAHTRASIGLATSCGGQALVAGSATGEAHQVIPFQAGMVFPQVTAAAQILAATGPDRGVPDAFTAAEWRKIRTRIADDQVAFDHGDYTPDLSCVAVPVRDSDGRIVAAICAVVLTGQPLERLVPAVRRTADTISHAL